MMRKPNEIIVFRMTKEMIYNKVNKLERDEEQ